MRKSTVEVPAKKKKNKPSRMSVLSPTQLLSRHARYPALLLSISLSVCSGCVMVSVKAVRTLDVICNKRDTSKTSIPVCSFRPSRKHSKLSVDMLTSVRWEDIVCVGERFH